MRFPYWMVSRVQVESWGHEAIELWVCKNLAKTQCRTSQPTLSGHHHAPNQRFVQNWHCVDMERSAETSIHKSESHVDYNTGISILRRWQANNSKHWCEQLWIGYHSVVKARRWTTTSCPLRKDIRRGSRSICTGCHCVTICDGKLDAFRMATECDLGQTSQIPRS